MVLSLHEDRLGNLWGGGSALWRWKPGSPTAYPTPWPTPGIQALTDGNDGALWLADRSGIRELVGGRAKPLLIPGVTGQFNPGTMLRDRNGGLWIGTHDRGILHLHEGRADWFTQLDGLSGDHLAHLYEDREGSIWAATLNGLDRFREYAVAEFSKRQGLSNGTVTSVLAADDGSVWVATIDGLNRWNRGHVTTYRDRSGAQRNRAVLSLLQDDRGRIWVSRIGSVEYFDHGRFQRAPGLPDLFGPSIVGGQSGTQWISDQRRGLFRLFRGGVVEQVPWAKLREKSVPTALKPDLSVGGLWLGFLDGRVSYFKDGQLRASYGGAQGLGEGPVSGLQFDRDGALLASTEGGLSRIKDGIVATLNGKNGLPCNSVHWVMEDDYQSCWLYTSCGLVRISRSEFEAWVANPQRVVRTMVFDNSDGVRSSPNSYGYPPKVAKAADGSCGS